MNSRKREKPYPSRHAPYSFPKRRRPLPLEATVGVDEVDNSSSSAVSEKSQTTVVVIGLPSECSVLDLKSRFEMYGPISRTRMDPNGLAYVSFRSNDAAQSAVAAARDPDFPITLDSVPVRYILYYTISFLLLVYRLCHFIYAVICNAFILLWLEGSGQNLIWWLLTCNFSCYV